MPKGRLGAPRPFDDAKTKLGIAIETEENVVEATVRSANGYMIDGERSPYFNITGVSGQNIIPELDDHILVNVEGKAEIQDVMLFINNLNQYFDTMIFPSNVYFSPMAETSRPLTLPENDPALAFEVETNRGTKGEFKEAVNEVIISEHPEFGRPNFVEDEKIAHVISKSNVQMKLAKEWARDILGPRNKKVTTINVQSIFTEED